MGACPGAPTSKGPKKRGKEVEIREDGRERERERERERGRERER